MQSCVMWRLAFKLKSELDGLERRSSSYLQHRELKILQRVGGQNGYEAWRQLVRSFEPRLRQRKLRLLDEVRHFQFYATSARAIESKVMEWEQLIKQYSDSATMLMEDDLKIAILLEVCPKVLQQHLRLNINTFEDSYEKFLAKVCRTSSMQNGR